MEVNVDGYEIKQKVLALLIEKYGFQLEKAEDIAHEIDLILESVERDEE